MNSLTWIRTAGFGAALAIAPCASPAGFVYENPNEFSSSGDFDEDGDDDLLLLDKATGSYRLAFQISPGAYTWISARASGVEHVTGVAVGRVLNPSRDALAVTAPDANRVNLLDLSNPAGAAAQPRAAFVQGVGSDVVIALDVGGAGNTGEDDLFVSSRLNPLPGANRLSLVRSDGSSFSPLGDAALGGPLSRGNRVVLKAGTPGLAGALSSEGANGTFRTYALGAGSAIPGASVMGLPMGADYCYGNFAGTALRQFLFYQRGTAGLIVRPVTEPAVGNLQFADGPTFVFELPIYQGFAVPGPAADKLLLLFADGTSAGIYDFDGINPPVLVQGFAPPSGHRFTGAAALGQHNVMLFSAPAGETSSAEFQLQNFTGSTYLAGASGILPPITPLTARANVFYFQNEPFVFPSPNWLGSANAGDWTSLFGQPAAHVTTEVFKGSEGGLDAPAVANLGALPALTSFGLVNQMNAALSMFSFSAPLGEEVVGVSITPSPGTYQTSVRVAFKLVGLGAGYTIRYREGLAGNWLDYSPGAPLKLFKATTLSYYAQSLVSAKKTAIRHATFQFAQPPAQMDTDGDGLPDFVEIGSGLDPAASGQDADGDGYSDLCEVLSGTLPTDPNSHPAVCEGDLTLGTILHGIQFENIPGQVLAASSDVPLRAFDFNGALLAFGVTANQFVPGATDPAGKLFVPNVPQAGIVVLATEAHFGLANGDPKAKLGRELLGLVSMPRVAGGLTVPYVYGNGTPNQEIANWVAAAQQAHTTAIGLKAVGDLELFDTLVALLFERKVREILLSRGFSAYAAMTLFPFRPGDAGRLNPPSKLLLSLEQSPKGAPAFRLRTIFQTLSNAVFMAGPNSYGKLKALTMDVYRVSSTLHNAAPPGTYAPPVDVLRAFLETGALPASYLAQSTLSSAEIAEAFAGSGLLLASVPSRPAADLELVVRPDSFIGSCTLLDPPLAGPPISLWHREGVRYLLPETFQLPPGSRFHVTGFTDLEPVGCPGTAIEVTTFKLDLASVPLPSPTDLDGDLLPDALELLLFGDLLQNGTGDFDHDNFSNLQELLEGTDPENAASHGPQVVAVDPPTLELQASPNGQLKLAWYWPPVLASKIQFNILTAADLSAPFAPVSVPPVSLGDGQFEVVLPNPGTDQQFYKVVLSLK